MTGREKYKKNLENVSEQIYKKKKSNHEMLCREKYVKQRLNK